MTIITIGMCENLYGKQELLAMQSPRRDHDMSLGDDVPLIDHHKLKESDKRLDDIVEVVAAIVVPVEH